MSKKSLITSVIGGAALVAGLVGASLPIPAAAATLASAQPSIPFISHGGLRDWRPAGYDRLYLQDLRRRWYRADLVGSCNGLPFAQAIGFDTGPGDRFDRFSTLIVEGQRCHVARLSYSEASPRRTRLARRADLRALATVTFPP